MKMSIPILLISIGLAFGSDTSLSSSKSVYSIYGDVYFPYGWKYEGSFVDGLEYLRCYAKLHGRLGYTPVFDLRYDPEKSDKKVSIDVKGQCDLRSVLSDLAKQVGVEFIEERNLRAVFIDKNSKTYQEKVEEYR